MFRLPSGELCTREMAGNAPSWRRMAGAAVKRSACSFTTAIPRSPEDRTTARRISPSRVEPITSTLPSATTEKTSWQGIGVRTTAFVKRGHLTSELTFCSKRPFKPAERAWSAPTSKSAKPPSRLASSVRGFPLTPVDAHNTPVHQNHPPIAKGNAPRNGGRVKGDVVAAASRSEPVERRA